MRKLHDKIVIKCSDIIVILSLFRKTQLTFAFGRLFSSFTIQMEVGGNGALSPTRRSLREVRLTKIAAEAVQSGESVGLGARLGLSLADSSSSFVVGGADVARYAGVSHREM